jgi:hypothetical protein
VRLVKQPTGLSNKSNILAGERCVFIFAGNIWLQEVDGTLIISGALEHGETELFRRSSSITCRAGTMDWGEGRQNHRAGTRG